MAAEPLPVEILVLRRALEGSVLPRHQTGGSPQRLLTGLLGEHWLDAGAALPLGVLIDLVAEFGISETSARATANRLVKRGVLDTTRVGRHAYYRLSEIGQQDIRHKNGTVLEFGPSAREWDGRWTLAAFSIPEEQRRLRHQLRSYLRWLGFAPLFDGLWISPHAGLDALREVFQAVGVDNLSAFRVVETAVGCAPLTAWDLTGIQSAYQTFLAEHQALAEEVRAGSVTPAAALTARTRLLEDWRVFPGLDPDLPAELLPADWPRPAAHALFSELYDGLGELAALRFRQIVARHDPDLAGRTAHHRTASASRQQ
ncbi:PaaX family transcriptional regulator C-terminal domain-containing protein [Cryptosporangium phraense]|uniref:Transcriptional regulator, PaaX family protein n=1 Tax=Cryptosporangium phraense TaxID=2593070 RepID=A0A545ALB0_9ACTN|nr:PaaX family transcriptional regulator C-terminal domain-containing protein [Cryptosporangium phraense]TQS42103.1 transcriptional regulator, PaaX family protein [Cryptosporangium phraense]